MRMGRRMPHFCPAVWPRSGGEGDSHPTWALLSQLVRQGHPGGAPGWGRLWDSPACHIGSMASCPQLCSTVGLQSCGRRRRHGTGLAGVSVTALHGLGRLHRAQPCWQCYVGLGGIRAACPPFPSPGISRGQRGAGSRQLPWGRKPGYFGGCGGGAVGWHCPCWVTPLGPALPQCQDGASGPMLCQLAVLSPQGAVRTGTPHWGGDSTSLGGPPGPCGMAGPRGSGCPPRGSRDCVLQGERHRSLLTLGLASGTSCGQACLSQAEGCQSCLLLPSAPLCPGCWGARVQLSLAPSQ